MKGKSLSFPFLTISQSLRITRMKTLASPKTLVTHLSLDLLVLLSFAF